MKTVIKGKRETTKYRNALSLKRQTHTWYTDVHHVWADRFHGDNVTPHYQYGMNYEVARKRKIKM